jgi:Domain of unknown function (DUF397)
MTIVISQRCERPTERALTMAGPQATDNSQWRKSTFSAEGNCVEMKALDDGVVAMRNGESGDVVVTFTREDFKAFVLGVKTGEFDDLI